MEQFRYCCFFPNSYVHIGPVLSSLLFKRQDDDDSDSAVDVATTAGKSINYAETLFPDVETFFVCGNGLVQLNSNGNLEFTTANLPMSCVLLYYGFNVSTSSSLHSFHQLIIIVTFM